MKTSRARGNLGNATVILGALALWALILLFGCSRKSERNQPNAVSKQKAPDEALAVRYECPILQSQLDKSNGSNTAYSLQIQRVLGSNRRLVAEGSLLDVAERGGHAEAVFELISSMGSDNMCIARLQCPTNLISTLTTEVPPAWWTFVFDVGENHQELRFSKGSGMDDSPTVFSVLTIEGKLIEAVK
jgi:hypothetical protein